MSVALVTARLALRPFAAGDLDDLFAMDGDPRVMCTIGGGMPGRTRDECARVLERMTAYAAAHPGMGLLHASRRDDGTFVGGCGLYPLPDGDDIEIAYRVPHPQWGRGYATEMAIAVLAHAFDALGLARVVGVAHLANVASQRVLTKIGMREEGVAEHYGVAMRCFAIERADAR
ncbi:MAG: GNAT family N-acetyltransferase [Burkholderiales bacterium]